MYYGTDNDLFETVRLYNAVCHVGVPHTESTPGSGRYEYGSGANPNQRPKSFLEEVAKLRSEGMSNTDIAKGFGMSTTEFRAKISKDTAEAKKIIDDRILRMAFDENGNKKMSVTAIAEKLGMSYTTVNNRLKKLTTPEKARKKGLNDTVDALRECIEKQGVIDVGSGVNAALGVTSDRLKKAALVLKEEGYNLYSTQDSSTFALKQLTTGKYTQLKVLAKPEISKKEILEDPTMIKLPFVYSQDGGVTYTPKEPIKNIDLKRVYIRYAEDGGTERDGTMEIRRGVEDMNLGQSHYAQVRIGVDASNAESLGFKWSDNYDEKVKEDKLLKNKLYLKGVAVQSDDVPDGYDIVFNTNKSRGKAIDAILKCQKDGDPSNPFGASLKYDASTGKTTEDEQIKVQRHYTDKNGKDQLSALNIVNEEGDWDQWSKNLPSQVLSKQNPALAKKQLDLAYDKQYKQYEELSKLTNPMVKEELMRSFADGCDSAAVHLKAAALPRQKTHLLLPSTTIKEDEIYAPNYENGETVYLIRFPHGGKFEIPVLKVNNNDPTGKKIVGNAKDAVCINSKAAEILSGADFDGDTALVIPARSAKLDVKSPLEQLKNFDTKAAYPEREGMKYMKKGQYGIEMGKITNLITDMSVFQAAGVNVTDDELARAVKHSMVVIDAYKHKLDYKRSYEENGIAELVKKYHIDVTGSTGAATLISKASSEKDVDERATTYRINSETGEKEWRPTNRTKSVPKKYEKTIDPETGRKVNAIDPETGKPIVAEWERKKVQTKSTKMYEAPDARMLSSGTEMEEVYADYANRMKKLGNQARLTSLAASKETLTPVAGAKETYAEERASIKEKIALAEQNAPFERQAQALANKRLAEKKKADPNMGKDKAQKLGSQEVVYARAALGIDKFRLSVTDKEWEAIQSGAVGKNDCQELFKRMDKEELQKRATPKTNNVLSTSTIEKIKALSKNGYTTAEIADYLGLSTESVNKYS